MYLRYQKFLLCHYFLKNHLNLKYRMCLLFVIHQRCLMYLRYRLSQKCLLNQQFVKRQKYLRYLKYQQIH